MELGRDELYMNASEEVWGESSRAAAASMEMMGFNNLNSNTFRTDSEELFRSWLTCGDQANNNNPSPPIFLTRHPSTITNDIIIPDHDVIGPNLYLAKAWFHTSQPMTRSRSSELRRRYAETMQSNETLIAMDSSIYGIFGNGLNPINISSTCHIPTNQSPHIYDVDQISSVVNMLKGTLERNKLINQLNDKPELEKDDSSSNSHFRANQTVCNVLAFNTSSHDCYMHQIQNSLPEFSAVELNDNTTTLQTVEDSEAFLNPIQSSRVSQEPSQSESSAAALVVVSPRFESCDAPCNLTQTHSNTESSRKHVADTQSLENGSRSRDFRDRIIDNLKDGRKRGSLVHYGSVTSAASVEKGNPTKKRRVERSRKMAESKERNMTSTIPLEMQLVVKRCENLEKEVRSLKLNLSFMNRKDSEQTKLIEDLQKQNEDMADEKERLLQQIDRILSQTAKL